MQPTVACTTLTSHRRLTDETTRRNFELYGHPDGKRDTSMGIALPKWIVESKNNAWVIGVYGLVFGILLPYFVVRPRSTAGERT